LMPKVVWLMVSNVNRRSTSELLRSLMTNLPIELVRDVRVFSNLIFVADLKSDKYAWMLK
jgi:predicted nuclease of predicted toxin-antitoxin system